MTGYFLQLMLILMLTVLNTDGKKPPGYVAPPQQYDPNPPKYQYGYKIQVDKTTQGKDEERDGIYAQGRYFVDKGPESSQSVRYFADDWGYHPVVEYENNGPYSQTRARFVLGEEAIKLQNDQKSIPQDPNDPGKADNLSKLGHFEPNKNLVPVQQQINNPSVQVENEDPQAQITPSTPASIEKNPSVSIQPDNILASKPTQSTGGIQNVIILSTPKSKTLLPQSISQQFSNVENGVTPNDINSQFFAISSTPQPYVYVNQPGLLQESHLNPQLVNNAENAGITPNDINNQLFIISSTPQPEGLLQKSQSNFQPIENVGNGGVTPSNINNEFVSISSTPQPNIYLNNQPTNNVQNVGSTPSDINNQFITISSTLQPDIYLNQLGEGSKDQPLSQAVYYVQQQHNQPGIYSENNQQNTDSKTPFIITVLPDNYQEQVVNLQQIVHPISQTEQQGIVLDGNGELNTQQNFEQLPEAQKLIASKSGIAVSRNEQDFSKDDIVDIKSENGQVFNTAALIKLPNRIVSIQDNSNEYKESENVQTSTVSTINKLIESTRHLVSGIDVLNINEAAVQNNLGVDEIETSTLQSLLHKYITPSLVSRPSNTDINEYNIISSTTPIPAANANYLSFLKQPIVAAESLNTDVTDKPVVEKTEENYQEYSTSARTSLISTTTASPAKKLDKSDQIIVTPRPVSSKFLAPITAGIQLQDIQEELFEDTKSTKNQNNINNKDKVYVQIQKTIPYYLGMLQYPTEPTLQLRNENITEEHLTVEQKANQNMEIGKTLLYFPNQGEAQPLVQLLSQEVESNKISELNGESVQTESNNADQEALQGEQQAVVETIQNSGINVQAGATSTSEEIQEIGILPNQPTEIIKYVDRPYPVQIPVAYPQPYPVEKVVQKIIKQPYPVHVQVPVPVEKVIERKIPVPYYIEKPIEKIVEKPVEKIIHQKVPVPFYVEKQVEKIIPQYIDRPYPVQVPQAYLLQIPGLFSQQKYGALVRNSAHPQKIVYQYPKNQITSQFQIENREIDSSYSYPAQLNQFVTVPQEQQLVHGEKSSQKLRKLNLLVFPGKGFVEQAPDDLQSSQSYRYSNAQLNNGYLPPSSVKIAPCNELQASSSQVNVQAVKKPEQYIGLVPPKRLDPQNFRTSRSNFNEKSIRLEYGFMPPLIPSLEIDEQGQPIHRDDKN